MSEKRTNKHYPYFEKLKASGQIVLKDHIVSGSDNVDDWVWKPQTLADYIDLAGFLCAEEIAVATQGAPDARYSELERLILYASAAFHNVVSLVQWSRSQYCAWNVGAFVRLPDGMFVQYSVTHPWILRFCELWQWMDRLGGDFGFPNWGEEGLGDPYTELGWPQNPEKMAFDIAGRSAMEAMVWLAEKLSGAAYGTFPWPPPSVEELGCEKKDVVTPSTTDKDVVTTDRQLKAALKIQPEPMKEVAEWGSALAERIQAIVPPDEWSDNKVQGQTDSLLYQLEQEYNEALKALEAKSNGKVASQESAKAVQSEDLTEAGELIRDEDVPHLNETQLKILNYLNDEFPQLRNITEINDGTKLDRKTIRLHLQSSLKDYDLIKEKDKSYAITGKGKHYIAEYFS